MINGSPTNLDTPHTQYLYYDCPGAAGDGLLYRMNNADDGLDHIATYYSDGHPQTASSLLAGTWTTTASECMQWEGDRLAQLMGDPTNNGLEESLTYYYDTSGRPYLAFLEGWNDGDPIQLAYQLVTTDTGDVVGLLDTNGEAFAAYHYDLLGNTEEIIVRATQLIGLELAAKIAQNQLLRYRGNFYSNLLDCYWDGGWYDPTSGLYLQSSVPDASSVPGTGDNMPLPWPRPDAYWSDSGGSASTTGGCYARSWTVRDERENAFDVHAIWSWTTFGLSDVRMWAGGLRPGRLYRTARNLPSFDDYRVYDTQWQWTENGGCLITYAAHGTFRRPWMTQLKWGGIAGGDFGVLAADAYIYKTSAWCHRDYTMNHITPDQYEQAISGWLWW